jgi:hypothetical protein
MADFRAPAAPKMIAPLRMVSQRHAKRLTMHQTFEIFDWLH